MSSVRGGKPTPGFFHVQYGFFRRVLCSEQSHLKRQQVRQFALVARGGMLWYPFLLHRWKMGIKRGSSMQEVIKEFMSQKRFAVIGATDNPQKYGNQIVKNLKSRGYEVYPVNPRLKEVEGFSCYPSLADIPVTVDVVDFVVPPEATEGILRQCLELGLNRIWLQPGSESEKAIAFCHENNLKVVHSVCVMLN
jgi:predicted CoA-binding protein